MSTALRAHLHPQLLCDLHSLAVNVTNTAGVCSASRIICSQDPMVTRWSEKSPGLKILWIWTLGTAGILITSVVRTRLHDMEKILKEEEDAARPGSGDLNTAHRDDEILREE